MKNFIAVGLIFLSALLALSFCVASAKDTVNSPVYLLSEHNMSIGLDPKFRVKHAGFIPVQGGFMDSFGITGEGQKGIGSLDIVSVSNDTDKSLGRGVFMQLVSATVIGDSGNEVLGNWTAEDARGQNVSVQTIPTNKSSPMYFLGKTSDFAIWSLGDDNYAMILSQFGRDVTGKIIRTLNITT